MSRNFIWVKSDTPPKCKLDRWAKQALVAKAEAFIADFYRPTFINPPPADPQFNYIVAFSARWHGSYLLFTAKYACPGPNALSPSFETHFARLPREEYLAHVLTAVRAEHASQCALQKKVAEFKAARPSATPADSTSLPITTPSAS